MKVLLVNPLSGYFKYDPMSMPPLGMLYVADRLRRDGHEVSLLDRNSQLYGPAGCIGQPTEEMLATLDTWSRQQISRAQPDIIGLTMMTCQWLDVNHMIELSRNQCGDAVTIAVGGYHPTTVDAPGLLREMPELDVAVYGRGEQSMSSLAAGQPWGEIPGLTFRKRSKRVRGLARLRNLFRPAVQSPGDPNEITSTQ